RGDEPANRPPAVPASGTPAGGRLPGIPAGRSLLLPGLARGSLAGRGSQPYGQGVAPVGGLGRHRTAVAAEAVPEAEPDGHAVGPGEGRHQCRQAVCDDRRAGEPLHCILREPVGLGSIAHRRGVLQGLLVEVRLVKNDLRTCLGWHIAVSSMPDPRLEYRPRRSLACPPCPIWLGPTARTQPAFFLRL